MFILHTVFALVVLAPIFGVESIQWSDWCIEIVAKRNKEGKTRIWGRPGAQTHALVIFYSSEGNRLRRGLRVHERLHIIQEILFGIFYLVTYGLSFLFNYFVLANFLWKHEEAPKWYRAYLRIPWEIWAFKKEHRFEAGEIPDAWGSK